MTGQEPASGRSAARVFAVPAALAAMGMAGLVSALVGDGPWDVVSWLALGALLLTVAWSARPRKPLWKRK
ncbi:MAG: hypothetical protein GEU92_03480 [Alphaproteobacteria bacterium]|nr:hypothetical protein [Alphaproteobacteria bacterium]